MFTLLYKILNALAPAYRGGRINKMSDVPAVLAQGKKISYKVLSVELLPLSVPFIFVQLIFGIPKYQLYYTDMCELYDVVNCTK